MTTHPKREYVVEDEADSKAIKYCEDNGFNLSPDSANPTITFKSRATVQVFAAFTYAYRLASQLAAQKREVERVAWLIENGDNTAYRSVNQYDGIHWVTNINKAIQFSRREDAEMFADGDEFNDIRIIEHSWINVPSRRKAINDSSPDQDREVSL